MPLKAASLAQPEQDAETSKRKKRKIVLRVDKTAATAISTEMMMMMMRQWK